MMVEGLPMDVQALLIHQGFLKRLAYGLLGDEALADDAVQDAVTAALEKPPQDPASLRSWLATATRNFARQALRGRSHRAKREQRAARAEAVPGAEQIAAREAVRREVVEAVLALPDRYRDVVLLRFYENRPPREIADILDLPVESVRTRTKRGLAKLRERLDHEYGGDRTAWSVALIPFLEVDGVPAGGGPVSTGPAAAGLKVLALAVCVVLAGSGLVAYRVFGPDGHTAPPPVAQDSMGEDGAVGTASTDGSANRTASPALAAGASAAQPIAPGEGDGALPSARRVAELAPPRAPAIVARIDAAEEADASPARVVLIGLPISGPQDLASPSGPPPLAAHTATVRDGVALLEEVPPGLYFLCTPMENGAVGAVHAVVLSGDALLPLVENGQNLAASDGRGDPPPVLTLGDEQVVETLIHSELGANLRVQVTDASGRGIENAEVVALPTSMEPILEIAGFSAPMATALERIQSILRGQRTDRNGEVLISGALGGMKIMANADGYFAQEIGFSLEDRQDAERSLALKLMPQWNLSGRVTTPNGEGIAGATLCLIPPTMGLSSLRTPHDDLRQIVLRSKGLESAADGSFVLEGVHGDEDWTLEPKDGGSKVRLLAFAEGHSPACSDELRSDGTPHTGLELVVHPAGTLRMRVVDARGAAVPGANLTISRTESPYPISPYPFVTREDGTEELEAVPYGEVRVTARKEGYEDRTETVAYTHDRSGTVTVTLKAVEQLLTGRVIDPAGQPVPYMLQDPATGRRSSWFEVYATAEDPTLLLGEDDGGLYGLTLTPGFERGKYDEHRGDFSITPNKRWGEGTAFVILKINGAGFEVREATPGGAPVEFTVDPNAILAARATVSIAAVDAETGDRISDLDVDMFREDDRDDTLHSGYAPTQGVDTFCLATGGKVHFRVGAKGYGVQMLRDVQVSGGERVELTARLRKEAVVTGRVVLAAATAADAEKVRFRLRDADGFSLRQTTARVGDSYEIRGLSSGRYSVHAQVGSKHSAVFTLDVESGKTLRRDLTIPAATPVLLRAARGFGQLFGQGRMIIERVDGRFRTVHLGYRGRVDRLLYLAPGSYRVTVSSFTIPKLEVLFQVGDEQSEVHIGD